jgi:hypothetical protein
LLGFGVKSAGEFCMSYECAARRGARERAISYINNHYTVWQDVRNKDRHELTSSEPWTQASEPCVGDTPINAGCWCAFNLCWLVFKERTKRWS